MSRSLPDEFRDVAKLLKDHLPRLLGPNLVGLYVYGSALDPSFVSGRSDLDCLLVTETALDATSFDALSAWLRQTAEDELSLPRIQMSLLVRDRVLQDDPAACLYQFGVLSHSGSDGNPIVWLDFFARGMVLHGPDPRGFVPEITPAILHAALVREVGYLREEISTKPESEWRHRSSYRAYAVLTLCRILYSNATGRVESKANAAHWFMAETPGESDLRQLVGVAEGVSNEAWIADIPLPAIERFIDYVAHRLGDSPSEWEGCGGGESS